MIRFSHTVFALPFAVISMAMAVYLNGRAAWRWLDAVGILLAMVCARTAAMAFNRLADREYDAHNPRTADRALPRGELSPAAVWIFTLLAAAGFVLSTLLFANPWPVRLAGPVLAFLLLYSYTKRFTALAHFWLGAALMLAPVAAWIAVRNGGRLDWPPLILGAAVFFWVSGFDIIYACQDIEFDRQAGLRSLPARLGVTPALRLAMVCHAITAGLLLALPQVFPLGWIYFTGVILVAVLLLVEHSLVRADDLSRVNLAFFHVNGIISVGLLVIVALDLVWRTGGAVVF